MLTESEILQVLNEWCESEHPRDKDGQFSSKDERSSIEIKTDKSSDIKQLRDQVREHLLNITRKQNINHPKLGNIRVSGKGIREFTNHSWTVEKLHLAYHLKDILETGEVQEKQNLKHQRNDEIKYFIPLKTQIKINEELKTVRSFIAVDKNGNMFYDLFIDKTTAKLSNPKEESGSNLAVFNMTIKQFNEILKEELQNQDEYVLNLFIDDTSVDDDGKEIIDFNF